MVSTDLGVTWPGILIGVVATLFLIALFGRTPVLRLPRMVLRLLLRPFSPIGRAFRRARFGARSAKQLRPATHAAVTTRQAVMAVHGEMTETELALLQPDTDDPEAPLRNLAEDERLLQRDGFIFREVRAGAQYLPASLMRTLTPELANLFYHHADHFFNQQVQLSSNKSALYEDVEGAVIISMLPLDRRCFYLLNTFRKVINDNVRMLIVFFSLLLLINLPIFFLAAQPTVPEELEWVKGPILPLCVSGATIALMAFYHSAGYDKRQRRTVNEMRNFLNLYLSRIAERYREATGIARGVTVGDETDSQKLAEAARTWHKIMVWMPFRTFFIESYVRQLLYQLYRNGEYYQIIFYVTMLGFAGGVIGGIALGALPAEFFAEPLWWVAGGAMAFAVFSYHHFITKSVMKDELTKLDWLGFDNLNVSSAMGEVVGKYAEDVGFWKRRLDR